ncbi:MAG: hypothetical protein LBG76_06895 [Treponema sp.]|jgi:hypothetical protein|nr:hypothetical protein [Treponema sp.]
MKIVLVWLCFCCAALVSCVQQDISSVARKDFFTVDIGRLEDQIDLFNLTGSRSARKTAIAMRDGLLYLSNGNGEKVVRYTSYGDLLFMIYNEETNPPPLTLRPQGDGAGVATRWAVSYPLREPGEIAVDSRKHIYVEDRFPPERQSFDGEQRALLDSMVLHFDADGRFVEYLGQEGIGGTPFPRITGMYSSIQDELAVICRLPQGWNCYWFDRDGTLLYVIKLMDDRIPIPQDRAQVFFSVDAIMAAPDARKLFMKVNYYRNIYDESTGTPAGSEPDSSVIWIMNIEDGSYSGMVEVPFFEFTSTENNRRVTENLLYSMLGVIREGRVFLSFPIETGYSLLVLATESPELEHRRGFIPVAAEELQYNTFSLSEDGILTGLLATDWEARLVWWRTDRLLTESHQ